jgi:hypothetical protein
VVNRIHLLRQRVGVSQYEQGCMNASHFDCSLQSLLLPIRNVAYRQFMKMSVRTMLALSTLALSLGCGAEDAESEDTSAEQGDISTSEEDLTLASNDFKIVAAPSGMPTRVWKQPASEGWFGEKGMCGPTSVSNALRLYNIERAPKVVFDDGVQSVIGTLPGAMIQYFDKRYPGLGATYDRANNPENFLLGQLRAKKPINILIAMAGLQAHWITVVGARKVAGETNHRFLVMTWGQYREVKGEILLNHWSLATGNPYISFEMASRYNIGVR